MRIGIGMEALQAAAAMDIHLPIGEFDCHPDAVVTAPCNINRGFKFDSAVSIGAFSYSGSFLSGFVASVGRYVSIAPGSSFGEGEHPVDWLSSHPFAYGREAVWEDFLARRGETYTALELPHERKRMGITIGNDVWIGARAYLRGGVTLGDGAIIGANAVVTKDVPPYAIVVGNPGRIIRMRFADGVIEALLALQWWEYCCADFDGIDLRDVETSIRMIAERIAFGMPRYRPAPMRICDLPHILRLDG
jgi:acetyltransferase-like isoleucine patch superfamily enzyme